MLLKSLNFILENHVYFEQRGEISLLIQAINKIASCFPEDFESKKHFLNEKIEQYIQSSDDSNFFDLLFQKEIVT